MAARIEDYALIGDCLSAALVGRDGSIDWLCLPRFDSGAMFAALLGDESHGRWRIAPAGPYRVTRCYRGDSLVLETLFETATGRCRLVDGMLLGTPDPDLVRLVEGVSGSVELEMDLTIRFDYGSIVPWLRRSGDRSFHAIGGPDAVEFTSPVDFENRDFHTRAKFTVREGERLPFVLVWHPSHRVVRQEIEDPVGALEATVREWETWASHCTVDGEGRGGIVRSLLTLKALTYKPTGGMVAAPTTSLPEWIGGGRNWDYRYCWVRDATFTLYALVLTGYRDEAAAWVEWLVRAVAGTPSEANIMYGLAGERRLPELELGWLPGYEGSRPVRTGNAACEQLQLDIFGELMDTAWLALKSGIPISQTSWNVFRAMLDHLRTIWREPDEGIWEIRGPRKHFTHSKVMAWVAFDRGIKIARRAKLEAPVEAWLAERDRIRDEVCERGFDPDKGSFTQAYGEDLLDASLLMLPLVGFLPVDDRRVAGTIAAIERELMAGGFVRRYDTHRTEDGLEPGEGVFLPCSFWLVDVYILQGRDAEARVLFERLLALRNDVGLLSEEYDPAAGRLLGNFPQAFSHIACVNTAFHFYAARSPVMERSREGAGAEASG
ncbi:MAG TPA: glycoside hydrolase family 15 protein [Gemmatimonadales bacterium]|nr:glycoside hydrolase family 15 protein [Gemmatimonadales bacterium]